MEKRGRILGGDHPYTKNLGIYYWLQGRYPEAAKVTEELLEKQQRILGSEDRDTLWSTEVLALT